MWKTQNAVREAGAEGCEHREQGQFVFQESGFTEGFPEEGIFEPEPGG